MSIIPLKYLDFTIGFLIIFYNILHILIYTPSKTKPIQQGTIMLEEVRYWHKIIIVLFIVFFFGRFFYYLFAILLAKQYTISNFKLWLKAIGLVLFVTGIYIRIWCYETLGKYFTFQAAILNDHKLIKDGPYKYLIHPSYSAAILAFIGIQMYFEDLNIFFLIDVIFSLFVLTIRVKREETFLSTRFQDEWKEYFKQRKRFIPGLF